MTARRALGALLVVVALTAVPASANAAVAPAQVQEATLAQDGLQLVWHFRLTRSFSPTAMQKAGQTLCLVISRARGANVIASLCLAPPRRGGRAPRLVFAPGSSPARSVDAKVWRSSTRDLTAVLVPSDVGVGYYPIRWQILTTVQAPACTDPQGCRLWFPAPPRLARLHTPHPVGCVPSGPALVYHGASNRRVIALTFDDGPWYDTPQFLSVLERKHVVATFFQIGRQIGTYGQAVDRRMLADGDMIGDHTWDHATVSGAGAFAAGEISRAAAAIRQATGGFVPCLFRAPGGAISSALVAEARSMGYTTIQWDIDPRDWARPGTGAIYSNVIAHAHPGAIVIQHDGGGDRSQTLAALPQEIDTLRRAGYQFVTVTELLGQRVIYK